MPSSSLVEVEVGVEVRVEIEVGVEVGVGGVVVGVGLTFSVVSYFFGGVGWGGWRS